MTAYSQLTIDKRYNSSPFLQHIIGVLLCLNCIPFVIGCDIPRFTATADKNLSVEVAKQKTLDVNTFNGGIDIVAGSGKTIELVAHLKAHGKTQEAADSALADLEPTIETTDDTIRIVAKDKKNQSNMFQSNSVSLEITVPKGLTLNLKTSNGDVSSIGSDAPITAQTSNGSVNVSDAVDKVDISTSNGSVTVTSSNGTISATSSNGNIDAKNCTILGDSVFSTSNGSVTAILSGESGPLELNASTSNGTVTIDADFESESKSKSRASGIVFPSKESDKSKPHQLKMKSSNGNINLETATSSSAA